MLWKYFTMREVEEALAFADQPNQIAVHKTGFPYRQYKVTAHLWAIDETTLCAAARVCGVQLKWIQRPPKTSRLHFDVFGIPLRKALAECGIDSGSVMGDADDPRRTPSSLMAQPQLEL